MDTSESSELHYSSDEEYAPPAPSTSSFTREPPAKRSRMRGPRSRGRGAGRGGTRFRKVPEVSEENLTPEDAARVMELRTRRVNFERERIQNLSQQEAQRVLERVLEREPGVIFDVLEAGPAAGGSQVGTRPEWCVCNNCREMPTDIEKKCCQQHPQFCISKMPHMEAFILEEGVLRLARRLWNDLRALFDESVPGDDNRQFRHAAYRQYVAWQYGRLGFGNRVVIPSCVVWAVRTKYPDSNGVYTGFIPRRL